MSIYHECRFKEVKLDLSERPDIISWLVYSENARLGVECAIELPPEITPGSICNELFHQCITTDSDDTLTLDISNVREVLIDYTLGNANKDNDIEEVVLLLSQYIISGKIILSYDGIYRNFDLEAIKMDHDILTKDDLYKYTTYRGSCGKNEPEEDFYYYY